MQSISRRQFFHRTSLASACALLPAFRGLSADTPKRWRAAVIGHTAHGDYGHSLDVAFNGISNVELVAVADPDTAGRGRAAQRAQAQRQYADYAEMLVQEKPELVAIAPRWSEDHYVMAMAALKSGAHLLTEKPFTATLAEADEILATAGRAKRKIAVAHQMRLSPGIVHLHRALGNGLIGDLVQIRSWGKQDSRAGGEDMMVLGTHVFDLLRLFAGDALWCSAQVLSKGHEITRADARSVTEKIGPVAGDEIEAQFGFARGVTASFTSRGRLRDTLGHWGMELLGSKGAVRILMDIDPAVRHRKRSANPSLTDEWLPLDDDPVVKLAADQRGFGPANRRLVEDWLNAIEHDREPECSGRNAMKAMEMVMAVYESALNHRQVKLPLSQRQHPLK
jgi:predicted dehydrogenase